MHVAYTLVTRDSREVQHAASRRQCMEAEGYVTKQFKSTCERGLLEAAALKLQLAVEAVGAAEGAWEAEGEEEGEGGEGGDTPSAQAEADEWGQEGEQEGGRDEVALADDDDPFSGSDGD